MKTFSILVTLLISLFFQNANAFDEGSNDVALQNVINADQSDVRILTDEELSIQNYFSGFLSSKTFKEEDCSKFGIVDGAGLYRRLLDTRTGKIIDKSLYLCKGYETGYMPKEDIEAHELGHVEWYDFLNDSGRNYFKKLHDDKNGEYVSPYAHVSAEEDFAETYRIVIGLHSDYWTEDDKYIDFHNDYINIREKINFIKYMIKYKVKTQKT